MSDLNDDTFDDLPSERRQRERARSRRRALRRGPRPARSGRAGSGAAEPWTGVPRWVLLVVLALILVAAGVADHGSSSGSGSKSSSGRAGGAASGSSATRAAARAATAATLIPTAPRADALSPAWYCVAGTASAADGPADHRVMLADLGDQAAHATVTVITSTGVAKSTAVRVGAHGRATVRLGDVVAAPFAAALVETSGGRVVVEQQIVGSLGVASAPCETRGSGTWYLPGGSTATGDDQLIALLNPYAADATVNLSFVTDTADGGPDTRSPQSLQGLPVPAQGLVVVRVGGDIGRHAQTVAVVSASTGSVVAEQLQVVGGSAGKGVSVGDADGPATDSSTSSGASGSTVSKHPAGFAIVGGLPGANPVWSFPDGVKADGAAEQVVVYNPSTTTTASAELSVTLADPSLGSVSPFEISGLAPGGFTTVDIGGAVRVPPGVGHTLRLRSTNGVALVAERQVRYAAPFSRTGYSADTGAPFTARQWAFAVNEAPPYDERIVLQNPGSVTVHARLRLFVHGTEVDGGAAARLTVPAGGRALVLVNKLPLPAGTGFAAVVVADGPVAAERTIYGSGTAGVSSSIGLALPETIAVLAR